MLEKNPAAAGKSEASHKEMANAIRALAMDAVERANSGHPGMPMGMADVATVLFRDFLKFDASHAKWPDRDRFILSAGHGSMLMYALLYLTGYEDITLDEIKNFRQMGAKTAGHPEFGMAEGIETTTGPLGQGLANSVGFALAEQIQQARFGNDLVDHYTYVIAGDGCLMEGISQEAISLAGHLQLSKLVVLFDDNGISIDGPTSLSTSEDHVGRFKACGWDVQVIDGHNEVEIRDAIAAAKKTNTPSLIACKTTIAFGAPTKKGTSASHGSPLGKDEIAGAREILGWNAAPFEIPKPILDSWRAVGKRGDVERKAWQKRLNISKDKAEFERLEKAALPKDFDAGVQALKKRLAEEKPGWATRKASGEVLEAFAAIVPELLGGSADLTGSNLTKAKAQQPITKDDFSGRYVYYGIREHAMAAAMNGLALHGGVIPYGGTFLVFTDYCRPAIRLSALMQQRVIYVMTHDSIGLGEDGPTHQPIEHLTSLRAIPNLNVFRPADAMETAECWELALKSEKTPSVLALTRQGVPALRTEYEKENRSARGAYILADCEGEAEVSLIATGSEVSLAMEVRAALQKEGCAVQVISMPCSRLFDVQDKEYKMALLCNDSLKVSIEAASTYGWERYTGLHGLCIGIDSFGESAPAEELYKHFGLTVDAILAKIKQKLEK